MKSTLLGLLFLLVLTGCDDSRKAFHDRYYLVEDIDVTFLTPDDANEDRNLFRNIAREEAGWLKDNIYFHFTDDTVAIYQKEHPDKVKIDNQRFELNNKEMTLSRGKEKRLVLASGDKEICGLVYCKITMTLNPVEKDTPELQALQQRFAERQRAFDKQLAEDKIAFVALIAHDHPGFLVPLNEQYDVRLPAGIDGSLNRWDSGIYSRKMGSLYIDWRTEGTEIYAFKNKAQTLRGEFIFVTGKKDDFTLTSWLSTQQEVIYQSEHGAAYYNQQGLMETVYFHYDDVAGRYFIGIAGGETLEELVQAYQIFRTIEPEYRSKNIVTMAALSLPAAELEEKLALSAEKLFDVAKSHSSILALINEEVLSPTRRNRAFVLKAHPRVVIWYPSGGYTHIGELYVHKGTREEAIERIRQGNPGEKIADDVYRYEVDAHGDASYSYFVERDGVVFEFYILAEDGGPAERMLLLNLLRQLNLSKLTTIPPEERSKMFTE